MTAAPPLRLEAAEPAGAERPEPIASPASPAPDRLARVVTAATWVAFALIVLLSLRAPPLRTGDAQQYYAMAGALADLRPPALTPAEVGAFKAWLTSQPAETSFPGGVRVIDQPVLVRDGRQEFSHFWFYPLLASPFVALAGAVGLHPGYAFLALNALLLAGAIRVVAARTSPVVALLLLASPLVWFVNKAQVETFTFACLATAMALALSGEDVPAALAVAVASTQNLPIGAAIPLFWVAALLRRRWEPAPPLGRNRTVAVVTATVLVALLHPAYYCWRLGVLTPQQINGGVRPNVPSPERYLAVLLDPDLGLLPWMPLVALVAATGIAALVRGRLAPGRRRDLALASGVALLCGAWFLAVFTQTSNLNSGGTVFVSRYALWLLPLAVPLLAAAVESGPRLRAAAVALAICAVPAYLLLFDPAQPERYVTPSPQAAWLNAWVPGRVRQVPEIFYERQRGVDGGVRGSAADAACQVILLTAAAPDQPCPLDPEEVGRAGAFFAAGWRSVWITRGGVAGWGQTGVAGAIPPGP